METVWHELLRAVVQDWTDMNGMPNTVNRVFGSISANFSRSTSPVDSISEGVYSQQGLYISLYLNFRAVQNFQMKARRILFKWLNRRSQRRSPNWEQYALFIKANPLPKFTICHALF